ncbi:BA75_00457T0 [Komagataella pastoris]|uniref:BA75_00457T0 n=1 Tax=Komagataella pastoris TaxID=4922 RepID=A0A1B2J982_PICPA|nr:BA75_00457T0 [Komagataella pastoris]
MSICPKLWRDLFPQRPHPGLLTASPKILLRSSLTPEDLKSFLFMLDQPIFGIKSVEIISGLNAGLCSTLVNHPLDLIKLRLQLNSHQTSLSGGISSVVKDIVHLSTRNGRLDSKALIKEFYRGITPNLVGNMASWALYFMCYNEYKTFFENPTSSTYLMSGFLAGWSTSILTNPIWVLKTRMVATHHSTPEGYNSLWEGASQILKKEGISGFWKGLTPALLNVSQGALQFTLYDTLKDSLYPENQKVLPTYQYIYVSGISKIIATVAFYPLQVLRSRMQGFELLKNRQSMSHLVIEIITNEGVPGLYKGIIPNLMRVLPATCITLAVYENTKNLLNGTSNRKNNIDNN